MEQAGRLIEAGDLARTEALLQEATTAMANDQDPLSPPEDAADAEKFLAEISLTKNDFAAATSHAYQAILRSQRFRPKAHFISAETFAALGDKELAVSKLRIVAQFATQPAVAEAALRRIELLQSIEP